MATNYIPLNKEKHKNLKVAVNNTLAFTKDTHICAATIREFGQLASCMPLVIIKDPGTERYHTVAMLGLEQNQNLFLSKENKWMGSHVPMNIMRYPFDIRQEGEKLVVYLDEESDKVGAEDGQPLFNEDGTPSEFLDHRQKLLGELASSGLMTQRFVQKIIELELLSAIQIRVRYADGNQRNVTGMFSIDEKRLQNLADEQILDLQKQGYLGAIYALMLSVGQLNRLVELSNDTENPIVQMQIGADEQPKAAE